MNYNDEKHQTRAFPKKDSREVNGHNRGSQSRFIVDYSAATSPKNLQCCFVETPDWIPGIGTKILSQESLKESDDEILSNSTFPHNQDYLGKMKKEDAGKSLLKGDEEAPETQIHSPLQFQSAETQDQSGQGSKLFEAMDSGAANEGAPRSASACHGDVTETPLAGNKSRICLCRQCSQEEQIEASDLKKVLQELNNHEQGFTRLLVLLIIICLFFLGNNLRYDTSFTNSMNTGVLTAIEAVTFGDDEKTYLDVHNHDDFLNWLRALTMNLYNSDGIEDICNWCPLVPDLALSGCQICYYLKTIGIVYDPCLACEEVFNTYPSECFDGTCDEPQDVSSSYPYNWDSAIPGGAFCANTNSLFLEKGLTSTMQQNLNGSAIIPYSSTAGMISNHLKLGGLAILRWKRRKSTDCSNKAIQFMYGSCKDYDSLIEERINTSSSLNGYVDPQGFFEFNEEAQANGAYLDLGVYGFGGWLQYCLAQVMEDTDSLGNAHLIQLEMLGLNPQQGSAMFSVISISFKFTPGGYVDQKIETNSFPILLGVDESTASEVVYTTISLFVFFMLPLGWMVYATVHFIRKNQRTSVKAKYYLLCAWIQNPLNLLVMVNVFMVLACVGSQLGTVVVFSSMFDDGSLPIGNELNTTDSDTVISQAIRATALIDEALDTVELANAMYFLTTITLLLLLLHLMSFHKRLALVKEVLYGAVNDLVHFAVAFVPVLVILSIVCTVIFGAYSDSFNSFSQSLKAMVRTILGDPGEYFDELIDFRRPYIGVIIAFSIQMIVSLVLLNIIISICVDSYLKHYLGKFDPETYWSVTESLQCYAWRKILRLKKTTYSKLGIERSETPEWQEACRSVCLQMQTNENLMESFPVALCVATRILECSPCHKHFVNRALKQLVAKNRKRKEKVLKIEVLSAFLRHKHEGCRH